MSGLLLDLLGAVPSFLGGGPTLLAGLLAAGGLWLWRGGIAPALCLAVVGAMLAAAQQRSIDEREALGRQLSAERSALAFVRAGSAALGRQLADERVDAARLSVDLARIADLQGECLDVPLPNDYFDAPVQTGGRSADNNSSLSGADAGEGLPGDPIPGGAGAGGL